MKTRVSGGGGAPSFIEVDKRVSELSVFRVSTNNLYLRALPYAVQFPNHILFAAPRAQAGDARAAPSLLWGGQGLQSNRRR